MNKVWIDVYRYILDTPRELSLRSLVLSPLWFLSLIYRVSVRLRNAFKSIFPYRPRAGVVISVGNLTVGGTGKTPVTMYLANHFKTMGYKVGIAMRGYKRKKSKSLFIFEHKDLSGLSPRDTGDEAYILAANLTEIPIALCANRRRAIKVLFKSHGVNCVILDDGFSQVNIKTHLNIVCFDSQKPFGNGCLIPRGILREPVFNLKRAHLFLFPKGKPKIKIWQSFQTELRGIHRPAYFGELKPVNFVSLNRENTLPLTEELFTQKKGLVVSGIGNPRSFVETCLFLYLSFEPLLYPDHQTYSESEIEHMNKQVEIKKLAWIMTTEKDACKLREFTFRVPVFYIKMQWDPATEFLEYVENEVRSVKR